MSLSVGKVLRFHDPSSNDEDCRFAAFEQPGRRSSTALQLTGQPITQTISRCQVESALPLDVRPLGTRISTADGATAELSRVRTQRVQARAPVYVQARPIRSLPAANDKQALSRASDLSGSAERACRRLAEARLMRRHCRFLCHGAQGGVGTLRGPMPQTDQSGHQSIKTATPTD